MMKNLHSAVTLQSPPHSPVQNIKIPEHHHIASHVFLNTLICGGAFNLFQGLMKYFH